jgi:CheY-like chemotaxis protein
VVKGEVAGHMLHRVIRYAVERRRAEEAQRELRIAQVLAQEKARLERGLLPSPLLADSRLSVSARCLAGGRQAGADQRPARLQPGRPVRARAGPGLQRRGAHPGPRQPGRADRGNLEVLAELKQDPELLMIPVIMLTTSRAEEDIIRSYSLHANAFVSKPVDFEHFIDAIRQIDNFFLTLVCLPH